MSIKEAMYFVWSLPVTVLISGNENASDSLDFTHENFHIMIQDGEQIRIAMILEHGSSNNLRNNVKVLSDIANDEFKQDLLKWNGNLTVYEERAPAMVVTTLKLYLIDKLIHNDKKYGNLWTNTKAHKNQKSENLLFTIKNVSWGQGFFYLKPLLDSVSPDKLMETKEIFIDLINEKRIIPYNESEFDKKFESFTKNKLQNGKEGKLDIIVEEEDWFDD